MSTLFTPTQIGRYTIPNRIIMAPMSRNRASRGGVVSELNVEYYTQRSSAGLIIAEATMVNDWGNGMFAPGIYNTEQISAWKKVTDSVHAEGGRIFLQLWHSGRAGHQSLMPENREVAGPSAIGISREIMTYDGLIEATAPRAFTLDEIKELRADFAQAGKNALEAGFDGIELHAAGGYLIDQFLQDCSNQRDDIYGGSVENRYRFLGEVIEDAVATWGSDRVGIKLSPNSDFNEMSDSDTLGTFTHIISQLNQHKLAYLHLNEVLPGTPATAAEIEILTSLRTFWDGPFISNGDFDAETGATHIDNKKSTAIAYGRGFIANPDLPERFKANSTMNELDFNTLYGGDHHGYTDYPFLEG